MNCGNMFVGFLCLCLMVRSIVAEHQLELVQIIFRHGDRTPTENEMYPLLPDKPLYEKLGLGQLTEEGKMREYRLGQMLRDRYGKFLGDTYRFGDVYAISTDYDRTKMSLQLVLGGLYPPINKTTDQVSWFPIPMHYLPAIVDTVMVPMICPRYLEELMRIKNSFPMRMKLFRYRDLFKYLAVNTGLDMVSDPVSSCFQLYHFLISQKGLNIPLPKWATKTVQQTLEDITKLAYDVQSYTMEMKKLNGGSMVKELLQNMNHKAETNTPKIYLYSGHELNVAAVAKTHGLDEPKIPAYGSAVIIEKYKNNGGKEFVQIYVWTGVTEKLIASKIPNCGHVCNYDKYVELMKAIVPTDEESNCLWNNVTKENLQNYYKKDRH